MAIGGSARRRTARALAGLAALCFAAALVTVAAAPVRRTSLDDPQRARGMVKLSNGLAVGYIDVGPRDGRPVVLIHGLTDNVRSWLPLVPHLDPRLRLILVDLRGHGRSAKPECCYTRFDFAYDVKLLLDTLRVDAADVIGHSVGSIVAQTVAELWPERVRRVVLISSTGGAAPGCGPAAGERPFDWSKFRLSVLEQHQPLEPDSPFMRNWYASPGAVDADFLRNMRREAASVPLYVWLGVVDQTLTGVDLQPMLPLLRAPTLLIWGGKDEIFGSADHCSLHLGLPQARVEILANLGHNPFWEAPQTVATLVNEFLLGAP